MSFGDIPIRQNGIDHLIEAAWFNSIRTELLNAFGTGGYIAVVATQQIPAGGGFTFDPQIFKPLLQLESDGGAQVSSATPFGLSHGYQSGKEIVLLGMSDTDTLTIPVSDVDEGIISNGKIVLSKYKQVILIYNLELKRFIRKE